MERKDGDNWIEVDDSPFPGQIDLNEGLVHDEKGVTLSTHNYRVKAEFGSISSEYSDVVVVTAKAPQNLSAGLAFISSNEATVDVSWSNTFPNSNYFIDRKGPSGVWERSY